MSEKQIIVEGAETVLAPPDVVVHDGSESANFGAVIPRISASSFINIPVQNQTPISKSSAGVLPKASVSPFFTDLASARAEMTRQSSCD